MQGTCIQVCVYCEGWGGGGGGVLPNIFLHYCTVPYHLYIIFVQNFPTNDTGLFLLKETERE